MKNMDPKIALPGIKAIINSNKIDDDNKLKLIKDVLSMSSSENEIDPDFVPGLVKLYENEPLSSYDYIIDGAYDDEGEYDDDQLDNMNELSLNILEMNSERILIMLILLIF